MDETTRSYDQIAGEFADRWFGLRLERQMDRLVRDECALNLCCAHSVARDVDNVVDPTGNPVVSIGVAAAAVAREIVVLIIGEILSGQALTSLGVNPMIHEVFYGLKFLKL